MTAGCCHGRSGDNPGRRTRSGGNALVATMLFVAARGAELGGEMRSCLVSSVSGCRYVSIRVPLRRGCQCWRDEAR